MSDSPSKTCPNPQCMWHGEPVSADANNCSECGTALVALSLATDGAAFPGEPPPDVSRAECAEGGGANLADEPPTRSASSAAGREAISPVESVTVRNRGGWEEIANLLARLRVPQARDIGAKAEKRTDFSPVPAPGPEPTPVRSDSGKTPCPSATADAPSASPAASDDLVPFSLEWDSKREFIEGVQCNFAFRIRCRRRLSLLQLEIQVNDQPPVRKVYRELEPDDEWQDVQGYVPQTPGALTVRLSALACSEGGSRERFEARRPFEHRAYPFRRFLPVGSQNINIDNRDNNGIIRLDSLRIPTQAIEDLKAEIDRALEMKDGWQPTPFGAGKVLRDSVLLRGGERDLLVVAGSDLVTFGAHSLRPLVPLETEAPDGTVDKSRTGLISRIHFTIHRDRVQRRFVLLDGGPSKDDPSKWEVSTNHTELDGETISTERPLQEGRTYAIDLAPGTVDGEPALRLSAETRGWDDPAAAGCPCVGNLSSILLRYVDNPRKAVLVVWGGADLGKALGMDAGPVVRTIHGRLHVVRSGERPRRLLSFEGRLLPGTSFRVL